MLIQAVAPFTTVCLLIEDLRSYWHLPLTPLWMYLDGLISVSLRVCSMAGHDKGLECDGSTLTLIICPISLMLMQEALAVNGAGAQNKRSSGKRGDARLLSASSTSPRPSCLPLPGCVFELKCPDEKQGMTVERRDIVVWRTQCGDYCSLWFMVANGFLQPSTWINGLNASNVYVQFTVKRKTVGIEAKHDRIHLYKYINSMGSTVHKIHNSVWNCMVVPQYYG